MLSTRSIPLTLRARALHTSRSANMPLYLCYCPDYPNNLETRLQNRQAHLDEAGKDKVTGNSGMSFPRKRDWS